MMDDISQLRRSTQVQAKRDATKHTTLRKTLPVLTKNEIRRHRLPYHEAILAELDEGNFASSAEYIRQLIHYQEEYRQEHNYDFILLARPLLKLTPHVLDDLKERLELAETAHYRNDRGGELDELIQLANRYAFSSDGADWWWLADQLYAQCYSICSADYEEDGGMRYCIINYLYGRYQLVEKDEEEIGMHCLRIAKELSTAQIWNVRKLLGKKAEKTIFIEACTLMYNCLIRQVKTVIKCDPFAALDLCMLAKQHGADACIPRAEIWDLQGKCEMEIAQPERAISSFTKALLLYKSNQLIDETCKARISLALAYLEANQWLKCNKELMKLLAYAEANNLPTYVGQAYLYIGQYYLNQGQPENASPYLFKAMSIFHDLDDVVMRDFVKNLAAVSRGQELFPKYVHLILNCESRRREKRSRYMNLLMQWKNLRDAFWEDLDALPSAFNVAAARGGDVAVLQKGVKPGEEEEEVEEEVIDEEFLLLQDEDECGEELVELFHNKEEIVDELDDEQIAANYLLETVD